MDEAQFNCDSPAKTLQRTEALTKVLFMFGCQVFLIAVVAKEVFEDVNFWQPDTGILMVFARFVCGTVLHLLLSNEL